MACESGKAREDNKQQDHDLENTQDVKEAHTHFGEDGMQSDRESDAGDGNAASDPPVGFFTSRCKKNISSKSQRVAGGEAK